jgi:hypothetical protein
MQRLDVPIGVSDFRNLRQCGKYYIDKTGFIREVLEAAPQVLLFPRPRRFGKSLNLSMLRYFLERSEENLAPLFEGLAVMRDHSAICRQHFQRYPVIYVRFKDVWAPDKVGALGALRQEVRRLYDAHRYLLTEGSLAQDEEARFWQLLRGEGDEGTLCSALLDLSRMLHRFHTEGVVILVDEYDSPLHSSYVHSSFAETVSLFRQFLSAGLKDNPYMFKGVLTGVLRVAKESIFSGLNNLAVYSVLRPEFATWFGFTEDEVEALVKAAGVPERLPKLRAWYEGYLFGGQAIYNPWSLLSFVNQEDVRFRRYWAMSNADDILEELMARWGGQFHGDFSRLLRNKAIKKPIEENIALRELKEHPEAVWSIMAMAGYLRAEPIDEDEDGTQICKLSFPNREVKGTYRRVVRQWMEAGLGGKPGLDELEYSLMAGNAARLTVLLEDFLLKLSSHDRAPKEPEALYHAFVMGLLLHLEGRFEVRSNRESGHGRYDVMVLPKRAGQPGVVLEFKVLDVRGPETPDEEKVAEALEAALQQMQERDYAHELRERGAVPIQEIAMVFHGKRVWVRVQRATSESSAKRRARGTKGGSRR